MGLRQFKITQTFTARDSDITEKYLNEVSRQKMVTKEEEAELGRRIKDGDSQALDILVRANLRFAFSVAKQYQNRGLSLNDLVNEANLGLIKAAGRFDETRGFKFISFAVWWIRQSILDAIANHSRIVRLPMNKVGVLNKYSSAVSVLEQTLRRTPTVSEVAQHLNVDDNELSAIEGYLFRHTSLDAKVFESEETTMSETIADDSLSGPSDRLFKDSLRTDIDRVFEVLTVTEKKVLRSYFGLKCRAMTLEEIADNLGCTKERVRQIKLKALKTIKEQNRHKILQQYVE